MAFKDSSVNRWRPLIHSLTDVMFFIMDSELLQAACHHNHCGNMHWISGV